MRAPETVADRRPRAEFLSAVLRLHARHYRALPFGERVRFYAEARRIDPRRIPQGDHIDIWNAAAEFMAWKAGDAPRPSWLPRPGRARKQPLSASPGGAGPIAL